MPARAQRSLVKPFEPSSCAASFDGPNTLMPCASRSSVRPATSGASGPMTTRPISFSLQNPCHRRVIAYIERQALGNLSDPGIAGRAIKRAEEGALLELPGERVLAAASTYQQHVQWR